ncbi:DUF4150 domain-containing protein [Myxococcus stipitatus]|uniref:PAAR-like domain-containing protein n=1 Tax=Myxococcus stipitatus TaxID=83455 RepID=UPI0031454524
MSVTVHAPKTPVTKGSSGVAVATLPNVCKMPGPPAPFVPTPLPNIGKSGDSPKGYSKSVTIEGDAIAIRGASFGSSGDMASKGTGGGLVSSNTHGPTKFIGPGSMTVKVEGKNVQLLSDPMLNNCGPSGSPANSATMAGLLQKPGKPAIEKDLKKLARQCNAKVNREAGYTKGKKPSGKECTQLGTKKHACCEAAIKKANNPRVKSEVAYDKKGGLSPKSRGQALGAGSKAKAAAKSAGQNAQQQKAAFSKAFYPLLPAISLDVVVLKDGTKPPTRDNIEKIYDFKFNCKSQGAMSRKQRHKYRKAMRKPVEIIHAR